MQKIDWNTGSLALGIEWSDDLFPHLVSLRTDSGVDLVFDARLPLVEILLTSPGHVPANDRLAATSVGRGLRYVSHDATRDGGTDVLAVELRSESPDLSATLTLRSPRGVAGFRSTVTIIAHEIEHPVIVRSVTSWVSPLGAARGAGASDFASWMMTSGRSDWLGEGRFSHEPLRGPLFPSLAEHLTGHDPRSAHIVVSTGTWSTGKHLPVGALSSPTAGAAWLWQVEHNGAWRWEIGENTTDGYLALSGPTETDHSWSVSLGDGDDFTTVPVAVVVGADLDAAVAQLTSYRRSTRRPHPDDLSLGVVFNDYMNTLAGDPTTAKLLPLIDAAADIGAEIFCIDAGWYDDSGHWWDSVGRWQPSTTRFPGGLGEVIDRIAERGMVPGLWLEPEVVGVRSPTADELPLDAFLQRSGQRIAEHDRFHLDLRHPAAIAHLDEVVDRLVDGFGVGFFKLDYNINPGVGTDVRAHSLGAGLLDHNRAHLAWLDSVLERHPSLILENCGSGAMRMDFAMLSRLQMQSTSDQQDFRRYPPIAASAPLSMLPEQAASWAYPQPEMSLEEVSFSLATGLLGRFYLSGYLNNMDEPQRSLVREAVATHKGLRAAIASSTPFWPVDLPGWDDPTVALGLRADGSALVTVWDRSGGGEAQTLRVPAFAGRAVDVRTVFPVSLPGWESEWRADAGELVVRNGTGSIGARVFEIRPAG